MTNDFETKGLISGLDKVSRVRQEISASLDKIADILNQAELAGQNTSGELGLQSDIVAIRVASKNLCQGVFRLLVLGDMKRGKSTFVNALIGENLLPNAVNPCTAILTILRYGTEKQVTVYFNNEQIPEKFTIDEFKQKYTIDPTEAKQQEQKKSAFSEVSYAVIEYPSPLLKEGVEIVDSPGLNDTESRNELSLEYINNCHAILFVLRASQPYTLAERRYLENYIKGRGLTVFFLINAWDQIREAILDPDDVEELREAEMKLRQVFQTNLSEYCQIDGSDLYHERVFEISAINALRRQLKKPPVSLAGTGFPEFLKSLDNFLTQDRAIAQLRQNTTLAYQTFIHTREAIARRLPLLEKDVSELKERISSVEPEFNQLTQIRDQFQQEIRNTRNTEAKAISESFASYVLNLGSTFETDFLRYQPDLNLLEFLDKNKREAFNTALSKAFEQYTADKIAVWTLDVEKQMNAAFAHLFNSAAEYGASYNQVTDQITNKLIGKGVKLNPQGTGDEDSSPAWTKWAMGLISLSRGNIAGVAMAGAGFEWKNILLNYVAVIGIGSITSTITGIFLGPIGLAMIGMGIGFVQADQARQELVKTTRKEFVKYLPQIAQENRSLVYEGVKECFDTYEREVIKQINNDIEARRAELDNLLTQKESREVNREAEIKRLETLEADISNELKQVENSFTFLTNS